MAGGGPLLNHMLEAWVMDIYANQLHRVISGTAPFRGLSNIGSDLKDLILLPIQSMGRGGAGGSGSRGGHGKGGAQTRGLVMRDLRRGSKALLKTVTRETLHFSQQVTMMVASAITDFTEDTRPRYKSSPAQQKAESNHTGMGRGDRGDRGDRGGRGDKGDRGDRGDRGNRAGQNRSGTSVDRGARQPADVVEGLAKGYGSVQREVGIAVETVIAIPVRQYHQNGPLGAAKAVVRALPIAVLRPIAGLAEGLSYTILGLRNQVDPTMRVDEEDMWNVDISEMEMDVEFE